MIWLIIKPLSLILDPPNWFKYLSWSLFRLSIDLYSIWINFSWFEIFWTIFYFEKSTHDFRRKIYSVRSQLSVLLESTPLQKPTFDLAWVDLYACDGFLNWNIPGLCHSIFNSFEPKPLSNSSPIKLGCSFSFSPYSFGPCSPMAPQKQFT